MAFLVGRPRLAPALLLALAALAPAATSAMEERVGERLFLVRDKPGSTTQFQMIVLAGCTDEADGCRYEHQCHDARDGESKLSSPH